MAQRFNPSLPPIHIRCQEFRATDARAVADDESEDPSLIHFIPAETQNGFTVEVPPQYYEYHEQVGRGTIFEQRQTLPQNCKSHCTVSMVYSTELASLFEVPYDCTRESVSVRKTAHPGDGWNRITFGRSPFTEVCNKYQNLWFLGHALQRTQIDSTVNTTDYWEDLLPSSSFENGFQNSNTPPTCQLAGNVAMIFGAVAFATGPNDLIEGVKKFIRPNHATPYVRSGSRRDGLINRRGVVIEIAVTGQNELTYLDRWEQGHFGPILKSY